MEVAGRLVGVVQLTNKTGAVRDEGGDGRGASGAGAIAAARAAGVARAEALSAGATPEEAEDAALAVFEQCRAAAVEASVDDVGQTEAGGVCTLEGGGGVFSAAEEAWVARFARMAACVMQPLVVSRGATRADAGAAAVAMAAAAPAPAAPAAATTRRDADAARRPRARLARLACSCRRTRRCGSSCSRSTASSRAARRPPVWRSRRRRATGTLRARLVAAP